MLHLKEVSGLAELMEFGLEGVHLAVERATVIGLLLQILLQLFARLAQGRQPRLEQFVVLHKTVNLVPVRLALELFVQFQLLFEHEHGLGERVHGLLLQLDLLRTARVVLVVLVVESRSRQVLAVHVVQTLFHLLHVTVPRFHLFRLYNQSFHSALAASLIFFFFKGSVLLYYLNCYVHFFFLNSLLL